jgi:hypothetical protein
MKKQRLSAPRTRAVGIAVSGHSLCKRLAKRCIYTTATHATDAFFNSEYAETSSKLQDSQLLNGPVPFPASPPFTDTGRFLQSDSNLWCRRSRYRYVRRHQRQSHRQNAELLEHTHCWRSHLQRHVYVDGKSSTKYCSSVELAIQDGNGRLLPPSPRKSSEDDSLCPLSVYRRGQSYSDTEEDAGIHAHSVLMLTMFCGLTAIDLLAGSCTQGRRRLDSTIL